MAHLRDLVAIGEMQQKTYSGHTHGTAWYKLVLGAIISNNKSKNLIIGVNINFYRYDKILALPSWNF